MGLDNYAFQVTNVEDIPNETKKEYTAVQPSQQIMDTFAKIPIIRGIVVGFLPNSFRGGCFETEVENLTGYSLYDHQKPEVVKSIYQSLQNSWSHLPIFDPSTSSFNLYRFVNRADAANIQYNFKDDTQKTYLLAFLKIASDNGCMLYAYS